MDDSEPVSDSLFDAPPMAEQERMVEAVLFASAAPVSARDLEARMPHGSDAAEALVRLRKRYEGRGVHVVRVGDAWAIRTAPDLGFLMQKETVETLPFEANLSKLQSIIELIEKDSTALEESLELFEEGINLTRQVQKALTDAEQKVSKLVEADKVLLTEDFIEQDD